MIEIPSRLNDLARDHPDLAPACAYYAAILPLLQAARARVPPLAFDLAYAQQKIDQGSPVFRGEPLPFPALLAQDLFLQLCDAIAAPDPQPVRDFRRAAQNPPLLSILVALLNGAAEPIALTARDLDLDLPLLRVVTGHCLKPFLTVWAEQLSPQLNLSHWDHGACPLCGSSPLFAELRGPERARFLRCAQCAAAWPYNRLQCVHCGATNSHLLGLLQPEGRVERASVQTCANCRSYIKQIIAPDPIPPDLLLVEDLSTLALDWIATQHGFSRPT